MKFTYYTISFIILVIIVVTPEWFLNDFTEFMDKFVLVSLGINLFIVIFRKETSLKICIGIALLELIYCITSVSVNEEIDHISSRLAVFTNIDLLRRYYSSPFLEDISAYASLLIILGCSIFWGNILVQRIRKKPET